MREHTVATERPWLYCLAAIILAGLTFAYTVSHPLNHDVAWLLEATRRWVSGEPLYFAIVEINPPLVLIENLILTGGLLTKSSYLAGTCLAAIVSGYWVSRWYGPRTGLVALAAQLLPAISDFGQRDHLALIFIVPYLLAPRRLGSRESLAVGVWAFFGVGLKPFFAVIPALYVAAQCVIERSWQPMFQRTNVVLATCCIALVLIVATIWPVYFTEMIPLGRKVYRFYGGFPGWSDLALSAVILAIGATLTLGRRQIGYAILAALMAYFLQGKFWHYQLIPALALAALGCLLERGWPRLVGIALMMVGPALGPHQYNSPPIPRDVNSVLFLSDRVSAAYPVVVECEVRNTSRYPTFWTMPGAWRLRDKALFRQSVAALNEDIRSERPAIIFNDVRLSRFYGPFNFTDWADMTNYRRVSRDGDFEVWLRRDLPQSTLSQPACRADPS